MQQAKVSIDSLFRFKNHSPSYIPQAKVEIKKPASTGIMSSLNYDKFELLEFNRNTKTTASLELSMKKHGWISAYPMHVIKDRVTGRYKIKAGHHRFVAAKKLGIPVKFVVCEDISTIYELEKATSRWTLQDYLISNVRLGNLAYMAVDEYVQKTGIPLSFAISLLGGDGAGSHNKQAVFKTGMFKLGDVRHAHQVADLVLHMKDIGIEFAANNVLVQAISKVLFVKNFSPERFKNKISVHTYIFKKKDTTDGFLDSIEDVYNSHAGAKGKIPLAFLAKEASLKRMPSELRK